MCVFVGVAATLLAITTVGSAFADTYDETPPAISVPAPAAEPSAPPPAPAEQPKKKPIRYVPNIGQPIFNEPAQITTEIRPIYIYHEIPNSFPSDGGTVHAIAVQLRAAITDRLAFIATKDGWMDIKFDDTLKDEDGFLNLAFGFKYAFVSDPENDTFLTVGLRYEAPTGNLKSAIKGVANSDITLQGNGDGMIDVFVTGTRPIGEKASIQASLGYDGAIDSGKNSSFLHAHVHGDYEIVKNLYGVLELNMIATADHGDEIDIGSFEGEDVFNFGNEDADTIFPFAVGARYRVTDNVILGTAYEFPLDHKDITQQRVYVDAVIHF
jgi:hypothetical protein